MNETPNSSNTIGANIKAFMELELVSEKDIERFKHNNVWIAMTKSFQATKDYMMMQLSVEEDIKKIRMLQRTIYDLNLVINTPSSLKTLETQLKENKT
jgi:hypothetical protein